MAEDGDNKHHDTLHGTDRLLHSRYRSLDITAGITQSGKPGRPIAKPYHPSSLIGPCFLCPLTLILRFLYIGELQRPPYRRLKGDDVKAVVMDLSNRRSEEIFRQSLRSMVLSGLYISRNIRSIIHASARPIAPLLFSADISCYWHYLIH